jgi:uncharacterized membrane protein
MEDLIARWTSLPNLHPAVVHFPIAILPLAVLVDAAGLALRRRVRLDAAAVVLYGIGLGAAGAAYWAGRQAADSLVDLPPKAPALIGAHADWALYTLWTFAILAALRGGAAWVFRHRAGATPVAVRVALLVVALPGLGLLLGTADRGGALVYRHGIAVSAQVHAPPTSAPRVASAAGSSGLVDALAPAPGFSADAVAWRPAPRGEPGPILEVRGRTLLTLPGVFSDVRLDAQLEILDFEGTIGLAHNVADADTRGLFTLSTRGSAALIDGGRPPPAGFSQRPQRRPRTRLACARRRVWRVAGRTRIAAPAFAIGDAAFGILRAVARSSLTARAPPDRGFH